MKRLQRQLKTLFEHYAFELDGRKVVPREVVDLVRAAFARVSKDIRDLTSKQNATNHDNHTSSN